MDKKCAAWGMSADTTMFVDVCRMGGAVIDIGAASLLDP